MEEDLLSLSNADLQLLYETFLVVKNQTDYKNSDVQMGFRSVFLDADKDQDGNVEIKDFPILIDGYFNSKHIKTTQELYEEYFKKIDLNQDGKINFNDYDVFIRIVYETEYLPALEKEINRRQNKVNEASKTNEANKT